MNTYSMSKNLLLICPHFMGYDEKIKKYAETKYHVSYIDSETFLRDIRLNYKKMSKLKKAFFKMFKPAREVYREKMLMKTFEKYSTLFKLYKENDIILVINGDGLTKQSYMELKKYNPNAVFILYVWDDVKALFKKSHFIFFDRIYTYNIDDSKRYNFKYLPMFTEKLKFAAIPQKKYDLAIIATANNERIQLAKLLYEKYRTKFKFYIYFYSPNLQFDFFSYNNTLDYQDYLKILGESKVIFEMGRYNQEGPTTRFFDALETKTKIVTTNKKINRYPIYGKNIYILDKKMNIPEDFVKKEFEEENKYPIHIADWMDTLGI